MPASTRPTLTASSALQVADQSTFAQPAPLDVLEGWVAQLPAFFEQCGTEEVSVPDTVEIDAAALSEAVTWASTALDPEVLAGVLAQVDEVDAIYVDDSAGETHIWTVLGVYSDVALDAVFDRELELHGYFGKQLAAVEFHVLPPGLVADIGIGRRVFGRVR